MELFIGFLGVICVCVVILISLIKGENNKTKVNEDTGSLHHSSNRNSYDKARDVFKVLEDAGIDIDFLGEQYGQE